MKHRIKTTLRKMAAHLGIKVVYVSYFGGDTCGKLMPREKRILINAHQPRCEHIFTILHEIGHFMLHAQNAHPRRNPWFMEIPWQTEWLARLASKVRRYVRFAFNQPRGREWEADLWAWCAFIHFAKFTGCQDDLQNFLRRHPEKQGQFYLAVTGIAYMSAKAWFEKFHQMLLAPFSRQPH